MGSGSNSDKTAEILYDLKKHPNYQRQIPLAGETKTQFILRSVSHLISPPQLEGESCEIECVNLARAVKLMERELEATWLEFNPPPAPKQIGPEKLRLVIKRYDDNSLILESIKGITHYGFGTFLENIQPDEIAIDEFSLGVILKARYVSGFAGFEIWPDNRIAWGSPAKQIIMPIDAISKDPGADIWLRKIIPTL